jgi:hypothetical protein
MMEPAHRLAGSAAAALLLIGNLSPAAEAAPPVRVFPQASPPSQTQRPVQPGGDSTGSFPRYPAGLPPNPPMYPPPVKELISCLYAHSSVLSYPVPHRDVNQPPALTAGGPESMS